MSREYTVPGNFVTLANQAVTLVWVSPPSNAALEILKCWIGQAGTATTQQVSVQLGTQVSVYPTLTGVTPRLLKTADPASKISAIASGISGAGINASTEGGGTRTVMVADAFNNLTGYLWYPTGPADSIILHPSMSAGFFMYLPSAPGNLSGWSFGVTFREV